MLAIELPEEMERRLQALAKTTGRSPSFYAQQAILDYLDDLEDFHRAERETEEVRAGRSVPVSLDVLMKSYGVAD